MAAKVFDDWLRDSVPSFLKESKSSVACSDFPVQLHFFASISNPFKRNPTRRNAQPEEPGPWRQMLDQFFWEQENSPDYRHTPEVERILNEDPIFEKKENPTVEEIKENERWWTEFRASPVTRFLRRAMEIADYQNELEMEENKNPYRREDRHLWRAVPPVIGLDGRPMPRKAFRTMEESDDRFWDFARQFFFGLWGFRQRPYPPGKPIDVAQAIGYKRLEKRYYDFIMKSGGFFYKDRLGRTRGPMEMIQLKSAWGAGIIDKDTFIWMEDMDEWAPISMIYGMERAIATWEVRLGAAATAFLHKLQKGMPPWIPLRGHEKKTYKQLQEEAVASKRRDMAVLQANDGIWPGVSIPSHALFLWASGSELTTILEEDHMPNKFIPKDLRRELAEVNPDLRPWHILSLEQAMDEITYQGEWFREPLNTYRTGPPYLKDMETDLAERLDALRFMAPHLRQHLIDSNPSFEEFFDKAFAMENDALMERRKKMAEEQTKKEMKALYEYIMSKP